MLYFWIVVVSLLFVVMAFAVCCEGNKPKAVRVKAFRKGKK